jgi:mannose/fructose/N-acetylgalactosamine-specific phosphotransferase system component IIB
MTPADIIGQIVFGWGSIAALMALLVYSDELADGNIEKDKE